MTPEQKIDFANLVLLYLHNVSGDEAEPQLDETPDFNRGASSVIGDVILMRHRVMTTPGPNAPNM